MWRLKNGDIVINKRKEDSDIRDEIRRLLPGVLGEINPDGRDEIVFTKSFDHDVGQCICIPRGEHRVIYASTLRRYWRAPYVAADPILTNKFTVVLGRYLGRLPEFLTELFYKENSSAEVYVLRAAYFGPATPPLPNDPRAREDSGTFWDAHALTLMDRHEIDHRSITTTCPWH